MSDQRKRASGKYLASKIEAKWQRNWEKHPQTAQPNSKLPKKYVLIEFPYPSGDGLHVGHVRPYSAMDAITRQSRLAGHNVLFPIGWDAFGLPTENYAIKTSQHPRKVTNANIANFRQQMKMLGLSFDWSREVDTTDPAYYKWTQWIFLQLFERGLAYQATMPINWCPSCKIGLANEEVVNGKCERCGTEVTRRMQKQWILKITAYAERLLKDLDTVDYLPKIKTQQVNWIGKSEGAEIQFKITNSKFKIKVFTTRPDTIFGATYLVVAPEHEIIQNGKLRIENWGEVERYIKQAAKKSDLDRTDLAKTKTGVELKGIKAVNPANNEEIPIWVADYVLSTYGTGAIMAVPAHDERDYEFAQQFKLPIRRVVEPKFTNTRDESAVHEGEPYVKRNAVAAVIRNPKTDKYLCISWKTIRMHGLVTGGVEEGEDIVEAAKRETREETGYKNIRLVRDPQVAIHSLFYHRVKEQNRWARFQYLFFELENEERDPVDEKEAALHEVLWLDEKEMANFFTVVEGEFVMNLLKNPNYIHTGEGVMRNSGQFDGMDSEAAGKAIINQLVGKKTSNIVYIHGSSGRDKRNDPDYITPNLRHWHGWFVRELSEKGYDVENPEMPRDWAPVYEEWKEKFDQVYVDENTILIGDSAGGAFVLRWLGETKRKIGHLILIAPTLELEPKEKRLVDFIDYTLDKGITERASGVTVYISNDTPARLSSAKKIAHTLGATIVSIPGRGHFTLMDSAKNNQFPELLDEVIRITSKSVPTYNNSLARFAVQYKLRDWVFSRQHYWGEPIPIIHCDKCGVVPVPAKDLPVELPHVEKYLPTDTGESPLANMTKWVNTKCPQCGGPAKRETDTMPNWAGSSWYYLRYCDPHNTKKFAEFDKMKYWLPVDIYNGGMEHTVLHLLYSRFWHKFLFDQKLVPSAEPYKHRHSHGLVLAEDGRKMSKSWGNVINPDDVVKKYGADTLRTYEMFMGPFEDAIPWSTQGMVGVYRFLDRVYKVISSLGMERKTLVDTPGMSIKIHKLVKKVTEDLERFRFNTVVSSMMEYFNDRDFASKLSHEGQLEGNSVDYEAVNKFLVLLFPFAPHIASELWEQINGGDIQKESWPTFDSKCLKDENFELIVQINGKVRGKIPNVTTGINQAGAVAAVIANEKLKDKLAGYKKVVYVPNRLINFIL